MRMNLHNLIKFCLYFEDIISLKDKKKQRSEIHGLFQNDINHTFNFSTEC